MKKSFFAFSILFVAFTFGSAFAEYTQPANDYESGTIVISEDTLLDDDLILTFVSHPEAWEHFRESQKRRYELTLMFLDKINQLQQDFPDDPQIEIFNRRVTHVFEALERPLPYEEFFAPLLIYGIGDTSLIADPAILKDVQAIQVKIFKNWLSRFHIGSENPNFMEELREYAGHSPLDLFSKIIGPILERIEDYDDIIDYYTCDDRFDYEDDDSEFEDVQSEYITPEIQDAILKRAREEIRGISIFDKDTDSNGDTNSDENSPVEQAIEAVSHEIELLANQIDAEYFYRDAILRLFLKVNNLL